MCKVHLIYVIIFILLYLFTYYWLDQRAATAAGAQQTSQKQQQKVNKETKTNIFHGMTLDVCVCANMCNVCWVVLFSLHFRKLPKSWTWIESLTLRKSKRTTCTCSTSMTSPKEVHSTYNRRCILFSLMHIWFMIINKITNTDFTRKRTNWNWAWVEGH